MPAGCSSRPPGTTAPATGPARPCATGGSSPPPRPRSAVMPVNRRLHHRWVTFIDRHKKRHHRCRRHRPRARRLVLVPGHPRGVADPTICFVDQHGWRAAREATRDSTMSSPAHGWRRSTLDTRTRSSRTAPSCGNQPAHISLTARRQRHAHHTNSRRSTRRPPRTTATGASPFQTRPNAVRREAAATGPRGLTPRPAAPAPPTCPSPRSRPPSPAAPLASHPRST